MADAVQTRHRFTEAGDAAAELAFVKNYLRVEHDQDDGLIAYLVSAAREEADAYLNNNFTNEDGEQMAVPTSVGRWILETVGRSYEFRVAGVEGETVEGSGSTNLSPADYRLLDRFRLIPGV